MIKESAGAGLSALGKTLDKATHLLKQLGFMIVGFFMARTSFISEISPLGAAFSSGVPVNYLISSALGAFFGYLLPSGKMATLSYTAALLAVVAIRLITNGIKEVSRSALWSAIVAFTVICGVSIASAGGDITQFVKHGLIEGTLAGIFAFFFKKAGGIRFNSPSVSAEVAAALLVSVSVGLTSLYSVQFDGISIGRIATVLLILLSARYGRVGVASVCGIASATAVCLTGIDTAYALIFCFAALLSGMVSGYGKVVTALAPLLVACGFVAVSSASKSSLAALAEVATAGVIFIIIPRAVTVSLGRLFSVQTATPDQKGLRRTLTMRLGLAATALHGVSETVEDVARCLAITQKPKFAKVLHDIENDACKGGSFHMYCWEKQRTVTVDAVLGMSEAVRRCQPISLAEVPEEFLERCLRQERFESSMTKHYSEFLNLVSAEKRVSEMRGVVGDQMDGIADMLLELSEEFKTAQNYDISLASRVSEGLKELDICADECSCVVDRYGRLTVEISLARPPEIPINRRKILERLEEICERDFEPPEINRCGRAYYITATEKAVFSVDCGFTQFNQGKMAHCGDTCRHFFDGRGRFVVIISDGMGSGGRAAVDSAMTAGLTERLIKAGFGYDCTLRMVNSAMLYKSTDESLATLDISCFDLYNGKTELYKAGAAPTIVRRNGHTGRAECRSLPAGILHEVGFDKATVTLAEDDILLMMSDGVCTDGTDWICAEVEAFHDGGAKQLADRIATGARRRRKDGHDDDITVFAAIIEKAV